MAKPRIKNIGSKWSSMLAAASGDIRRLDYVIRFGSIPVAVHELTSTHSYWVALYSMMIHNELSEDKTLLGPILAKAVAHDTAEAVTSDIVRTCKYSTPELKREVDRAEGILTKRMHPGMQSTLNFVDAFVEASGDAEYVKAVVKAADFLSLQQYMNREHLRGNREIEPFIGRMINDLNDMGVKYRSHSDPRLVALGALYPMMAGQVYDTKGFVT